jgi:hypothetical protein
MLKLYKIRLPYKAKIASANIISKIAKKAFKVVESSIAECAKRQIEQKEFNFPFLSRACLFFATQKIEAKYFIG